MITEYGLLCFLAGLIPPGSLPVQLIISVFVVIFYLPILIPADYFSMLISFPVVGLLELRNLKKSDYPLEVVKAGTVPGLIDLLPESKSGNWISPAK